VFIFFIFGVEAANFDELAGFSSFFNAPL